MQRFLIPLLGVVLLSVGCRPSRATANAATQAGKKDLYLILAEELAATQRENLFDAVRQLRPSWFSRVTRQRSGDEGILVYLDERQVGDATTLRRFSTRSIASVKYLAPTEAQVRFGQANGGRPAIVLEAVR